MLYLLLIIVLIAVIAAGIMNRSQDKDIAKILDNGQPKPEVTREGLLENTKMGWVLKFFLVCIVLGNFYSAAAETVVTGTLIAAVLHFPVILIAIFTAIAFVRRDRDAVFLAKSYLFTCLALNLVALFGSDKLSPILGIGLTILWFLFLIFSENVGDVCPVEYRRTSVRGWVLIGLFVVTVLALYLYFVSLALR